MPNIDYYISELLFEFDCVIIPDLGGFVCNYAPATIHPVQHIFTPPSKKTVFNQNLKNNDGLLIHHIAQRKNTNYSEATKMVQDFVQESNQKLNRKESVNFKDVGILFMDVERNLQFEPDQNVNYLVESFGLASFQSPAIKRENINQRIEKEFKDRVIIPSKEKKINYKKLIPIAVSLPLLFAMLWVPLKTDLLKNIDYSSLNPFSKKENSVYEIRNSSFSRMFNSDLDSKGDIFDNVTSNTVQLSLLDEIPHTITVRISDDIRNDEKDELAPSNRSLTASENGKYHVIGGCFAIVENAENFIHKLKSQGFAARILGNIKSHLRYVAVSSHITREEANTELAKIRSTNPEAWLLVK